MTRTARRRPARRRAPEPREAPIPRAQRVFTNRNLRLSGILAIGFDLDHTLAHYDPEPVERLAFEATKEKLVAHRGYPEELLRLRYDPAFVIRGLVVDKKRGNILKMDYFKYVRRVFHGRRPMTGEERRRQYRSQQLRLSHPNYVSVDTLFHLPEVYLYAALVDLLEARDRRCALDYSQIYQDVREMIDQAHADGTIKREIVNRPDRFVRRDPKLAVVLEEFRRSGKRLFLLTNSEYYYSDALLRHLLERRPGDRPWEEYFDLLVFDSAKPGFFLNTGRGAAEARPIETRTERPTFSGGHARWLEEAIEARGDQVLYFGDHTYGDILRSKKTLGWRTAMIVPEIENEVAVTQRLAADYQRLQRMAHARDEMEIAKAEIGRRWRRLAGDEDVAGPIPAREGTTGTAVPAAGGDGRRRRQLARLERQLARLDHRSSSLDGEIRGLRRRIESAYNPYWGSVFREGNVITRLGDQVRDFACVYTSRVSNFLHYPWNYYFQSPFTLMPHDL